MQAKTSVVLFFIYYFPLNIEITICKFQDNHQKKTIFLIYSLRLRDDPGLLHFSLLEKEWCLFSTQPRAAMRFPCSLIAALVTLLPKDAKAGITKHLCAFRFSCNLRSRGCFQPQVTKSCWFRGIILGLPGASAPRATTSSPAPILLPQSASAKLQGKQDKLRSQPSYFHRAESTPVSALCVEIMDDSL